MRNKAKIMAVFSLLNLPLLWLIASRYMAHAELASTSEVVYVSLVMLGHLGFLFLLAFVPLVLISTILPQRLNALLGVLVAAVLQVMLLTDTYIYDLYRFHFSSFVLDLLLNGGNEVFSFSWTMWGLAILMVLGLLLVQCVLWWLAGRVLNLRTYIVVLILALLAQVVVHVWHAWADANYRSDVTSYTRHFPYFYPATAKRQMADWGFTDPQSLRENMNVSLSVQKNRGLNYPASDVICTSPAKPDNLLVILVDTLRHDMLDETIMPNLYRFAHKPNSFMLENHFSGGNSTKAGVFSLFYGLPVSYWDAFTSAQKPPVLMEKFQEADYDFKILSSATLVSPAFDRNVFAGLTDVPLYTAGGAPWQRDLEITNKWQEWVSERPENSAPFFGFLFYDAVHGYSVPDGYQRFEPYWESVNHLALNRDFDRTPYFNRYKTSAHFVDSQLERVFKQLEESGLLDSTVVVITSDHGESFNEHGRNFWGHGSNYTKEQTQVPMVVYWPGNTPKAPALRTTSHADLPVTLLEGVLGCQSADYAYTLGKSFFSERTEPWVISGSYLGQAVLLPEHYLDILLSGQYQAYTYDAAPDHEYKIPPKVAADVLKALSRFYQ